MVKVKATLITRQSIKGGFLMPIAGCPIGLYHSLATRATDGGGKIRGETTDTDFLLSFKNGLC